MKSTVDLYSANRPQAFWGCQPDPPVEVWEQAINLALPILGLPPQVSKISEILEYTLGEGQIGPGRWQLGLAKRWYYDLKPLLPRPVINLLKRASSKSLNGDFPISWPVEDRYVRFMREVVRQALRLSGRETISYRNFWPEGMRFAVVLTHDVESQAGVEFVRRVADLEQERGFRSSFNFVPQKYPLDVELAVELRQRGFEVGIHGLKHDGKLYRSFESFAERAKRINDYIHQLDAVGFRSPYMHRHPVWLQELDVEYDLSFFDSDPYEPMPGGCMSIWPFFLGKFVELPYTLCQDSTLGYVLKQTTPGIWLEKLRWIEANQGMALLNTHPDYLSDPVIMKMYLGLLDSLAEMGGYWHALPSEVARWWRRRNQVPLDERAGEITLGQFELQPDAVVLEDSLAQVASRRGV